MRGSHVLSLPGWEIEFWGPGSAHGDPGCFLEGRLRTVKWAQGVVRMVDQRKLPHEYVVLECKDHREVAKAIKEMAIRGAPAIGAAAAYGLALAGQRSQAKTRKAYLSDLEAAAQELLCTRPTANNLSWALARMLKKAESLISIPEIKAALVVEAEAIANEDVEINRRLGEHGASLLSDGARVLTHCNAGALATVDYGTALSPIRVAHAQGKRIHVYVDETRPRLQGAKLTAWELMHQGIPMTLIADNAAGYFMQRGMVDIVLVGADRVVANGDVANKIGTYKLAVVAKENKIPFYAVVPTPTIDLSIASGDLIPIEERDVTEVTHIDGVRVAPAGVRVANPAFDITPHRYLTGIITEHGILRPPFDEGLRAVAVPRVV